MATVIDKAPANPKNVRGIRNNNPGNIEWGSPWQGLLTRGKDVDPRFCVFSSPIWGIRALACTLITYQDKRRAKDGSAIDTVREVIERWAPPTNKGKFENDTAAYISYVCSVLTDVTGRKVTRDTIIDIHQFDIAFGLVSAIIRHENGPGPLDTENTWYTDEQVTEGLRRAGVVKPVIPKAGVPVTQETVGAAAGAVVGGAQLVDVLPSVMQAMDKSHDDISSGDWVRIAFGVVTIGAAVYVAYAQYRRRKLGLIG